MKTTRQSTFETNSSSTHAISLAFGRAEDRKRTVTLLPSDEPLVIRLSSWVDIAEADPLSKLNFIVAFMLHNGQEATLREHLKNASEFFGRQIGYEIPEKMREDFVLEDEDSWKDTYSYYFREDYTYDTVEEFRAKVLPFTETADKFIDFICDAKIGFNEHTYYDG